MGRTTIIPGDPYEAHARAAREALEWQRDSHAQRARITTAQIAAGAIQAANFISGAHGWRIAKERMEHETGIYRAGLGSRTFTNCCNCGAPRQQAECSYCKSVTP